MTAGKTSSNTCINSALANPVVAIDFLSAAISAFDCIPKVAIIACHFPASDATIPVDAPLILVSPGMFGNSDSA